MDEEKYSQILIHSWPSGICGSDIHTIDSGWGQVFCRSLKWNSYWSCRIISHLFLSFYFCRPSDYPCVVGHEIVGEVTRVGNKVTKFKVGDRAGVGAQSYACLECGNCKDGFENLCEKHFVSLDGHAVGLSFFALTFPLWNCTLVIDWHLQFQMA